MKRLSLFVFLSTLLLNSQCRYLSIYEEYEKSFRRILEQPHSEVKYDLNLDKTLKNRNEPIDSKIDRYNYRTLPINNSEEVVDYMDYENDVLSSEKKDIGVAHPKEFKSEFQKPNKDSEISCDKVVKVGVHYDKPEYTRRHIIVKPVIQYVIHQFKNNQDKNDSNQREDDQTLQQQQSGSVSRGWGSNDGGTFSFGNNGHNHESSFLEMYNKNDHGSLTLNLDEEGYFDTNGQRNNFPSSIDSGRIPYRLGNDNNYLNTGESFPTPFSSQSHQYMMGAYQNSPNGNLGADENFPVISHQPQMEVQLQQSPMQTPMHQTTMNNDNGNLNQAVSQSYQDMMDSVVLTNTNYNNIAASESILTRKFGANPSIAEAISSLLSTIAKHGEGNTIPQNPSNSQYGSYVQPSEQPQTLQTLGAQQSNPVGNQQQTLFLSGSNINTISNTLPSYSVKQNGNGIVQNPSTMAVATLATPSHRAPVKQKAQPASSSHGIKTAASPWLTYTSKGAQTSSVWVGGNVKSRHQSRAPKRGRPLFGLRGLNAYFKFLVSGGIGGDGINNNGKEDEEQSNSDSSGRKGRGFTFGFSYPPILKGSIIKSKADKSLTFEKRIWKVQRY